MRQKIELAVLVVALVVAGLSTRPMVAQVSLEDQLKAQFTMVKMGSDTSGAAVVEAGTILAIKKGGILSVPNSDQSILSTKYEGGVVHSPNTLLSKGIGFGMKKFGKEQTTRLMQVGEKVYPSRIAVDIPKDHITMGIIACDSCNNTGYRGRSGIYEMMLIDDDIRQLILKNVDSGTIKKQAVSSKGMRTLMDDGALKVLKGGTSIAEVLSVTQEDLQ